MHRRRHGKKSTTWNDLSVGDFRVLTEKITLVEAADALCREVDAAVRRVAEDLSCPESEDALLHPGMPKWRDRAKTARVYLEKKRAIAVSRLMALGGVPPDIFEEIEQESAAVQQERRKVGPKGVLDHLRAIVEGLAAADVMAETDERVECLLCGAACTAGEPLSDHLETCPWRRAVEEVENFSTCDVDPATITRFEKREFERVKGVENTLLHEARTRIANLEKKLERQIQHGHRMDDERNVAKTLLAITLQAVMRHRLDSVAVEILPTILSIDPQALDPKFWDRDLGPAIERALKAKIASEAAGEAEIA